MERLFLLFLTITTAFAFDKAALQEYVKANNLFAASIYSEISKLNPEKNLLVSPFSAETVLTFTQSGCKGDTAQELRKALYLSDNDEQIKTGVKSSLSVLTGNKFNTLHVANKMYVKDNFTINKSFKNVAVNVYGADVDSIDFNQKKEAAESMNKWVEQKTESKIHNLINPDNLNMYTRVILINSLYFKGNWSIPFKKSQTRRDKFFKTSLDVTEVDMMREESVFCNYLESLELDAKILELPFRGENVSMIIALPNDKEGLAALEKQTKKVYNLRDFKEQIVTVDIPKFKIETTIEFVKILTNLGVTKLFTDGEADLSGIAGDPGKLVVSNVLQKTYIDVQERGVEAAAATYVGIEALRGSFDFEDSKKFTADHPFMFYIKAKNFILFAGRVTDPSLQN